MSYLVIFAIAVVVLLVIALIVLAFYIPSKTSTTESSGIFSRPGVFLAGANIISGTVVGAGPVGGPVVGTVVGANTNDVDTAAINGYNDNQVVDTSCKALVDLWRRHVVYTHDFLDAAVNKKANFDNVQAILLDNQVQLGKYYGAACGVMRGKIIGDLLTQHILEAKDIVVADLAGKPIDALVARWYKQADDVAAAIYDCVGKQSAEWYKDQMKTHIDTTLVE